MRTQKHTLEEIEHFLKSSKRKRTPTKNGVYVEKRQEGGAVIVVNLTFNQRKEDFQSPRFTKLLGNYGDVTLDDAYLIVEQEKEKRYAKVKADKIERANARRAKLKERSLNPKQREAKVMLEPVLAEIRNKRKLKNMMGKDSSLYPRLDAEEHLYLKQLNDILKTYNFKMNQEKLINKEIAGWG